jgi:hypothetical protein
MEMAHNAAAEKSGATKYNHAQRHDAKLSHQLRLTAGAQSPHRAGASQKAIVSRDTSSIEFSLVWNVRQLGTPSGSGCIRVVAASNL